MDARLAFLKNTGSTYTRAAIAITAMEYMC